MAFRSLLLLDGISLPLEHGWVFDQRQKIRLVWMLAAMVPSQITGFDSWRDGFSLGQRHRLHRNTAVQGQAMGYVQATIELSKPRQPQLHSLEVIALAGTGV